MIPLKMAHGAMVICVAAIAAYPQTRPSPSVDQIKAESAKLYAGAHPYMDEPLPELKKEVHELAGLKPASSQDSLPDLLAKIGAKADELLQSVPDLVSDEAVSRTWGAIPKGEALGCTGGGCAPPAPIGREQDETFQYLILTHAGALGRVTHSEARVTRKGKLVDATLEPPNFPGFLPAWVLFYPVNQMESRFRYLGQQQLDGHSTFVIGFAQLPGSIASLDRPILLQGIAWVDQSDFRIVHLHTDLLAPMPGKKLAKQTSDIALGPIELAESHLQLWLPSRVEFEMEANGQFFHEEHNYSHYGSYKTSSSSSITSSASELKENDAEKMETKLYAGAHPYIDEPLPDLRKDVHELAGLTPAPSQDPLPDLLAKTGAKADELLHRIPNLICDEGVSESHYPEETTNGCIGAGCMSPATVVSRDESFHYMILAEGDSGRMKVSEYRTARNGKPIGSASAGAPMFQGFISAWIVFSSANQAESRFRYLGEQRLSGRATYVLGFAQIPDQVQAPGEIVVDSQSIPMLLQGVAWIDQADFRIVRLRTDLLAPLPLIMLEKQTANIAFGPVRIASLDSELWLPKTVTLRMDARGQMVQEEHKYSRYRLYQAKSRIVLSPGNEPAAR